jgi:hypothetical protein
VGPLHIATFGSLEEPTDQQHPWIVRRRCPTAVRGDDVSGERHRPVLDRQERQ